MHYGSAFNAKDAKVREGERDELHGNGGHGQWRSADIEVVFTNNKSATPDESIPTINRNLILTTSILDVLCVLCVQRT